MEDMIHHFRKTRCFIAMVKILEKHQWKSSLFSNTLFVDLQ